MAERITAVFDDEQQADKAIDELRHMGVPDSHLSVIARSDLEVLERKMNATETDSNAAAASEGVAGNAGTGLLAGAGIGALFGLAAAVIPGIGPFITAGALVSALGVCRRRCGCRRPGRRGQRARLRALSPMRVTAKTDATYYGGALEKGGVLVAVDAEGTGYTAESVLYTLEKCGGRSAANSL